MTPDTNVPLEPQRVDALGAKCVSCGHAWIVGYAPIALSLMAELAKRAMCPKCGHTRPDVASDSEVLRLLRKEREA